MIQKLRQSAPAPSLIAGGGSWANRADVWPHWWAGMARRQDVLACAGLVLTTFWLYAATLLPGIGARDTAELQRVAATLGLAHPTGYPLYTLFGWLWSHLPLGGTPAWRMNLFSAAAAALTIGVVYLIGRALGQRRIIAGAVAATLAASRTFWSQATIAEVYALAALLQGALILAVLRWRAGRLPFWAVGLMLGLGLAHHRAIILMIPGLLLFLALSRRAPLDRPALGLVEIGAALVALLGPCLLYLYLPLRAPIGANPLRLLWEYASGADMASAWLDLPRLWSEGSGRLLDLARRFVWPQMLPFGGLLALLGAIHLLWRDRAGAALLIAGYGAVVAFCAAYYVDDVEVFFISAHLIAALLIGEGAMLVRRTTTDHQGSRIEDRGSRIEGCRSSILDLLSVVGRWSFIDPLLLALPALLLIGNLSYIRAANTLDDELAARTLLAEPLPTGALVIGDWASTEGPHYLQAVEGLRPDLQFGVLANREVILDMLAHGRAVYLMKPVPALGLAQQPEGRLWRVSVRPLVAKTRADIRWDEGIVLSGYTLPRGPCRPGDVVPIALAWRVKGPLHLPYTLFVHLVAADGTIWGQLDRAPTATPTDRWRPGAQPVDLYAPVLDPATPPGHYRVNIGWYAYPSMQRLGLAAGDSPQQAGDYVTIGEIEVAPER